MAETNEEMLTAKKIAEKLGVSEGKVKKAIKEANIEPDQKKGPCAYYGPANQELIKSNLG